MSTLTTYNGLQVVDPEPSADGGKAINDNFKALSTALEITDPSSSDDSSAYFSVGSRWFNSTTGVEWLCTDASVGAAVWQATTPTLDTVTNAGNSTANALEIGALSATSVSVNGGNINLNDGSGTGGGTLNVDSGTIANAIYGAPLDDVVWPAFYLTIGSIIIDPGGGGGLAPSQWNGYSILMNDGSGSGGGNIAMDGGQIGQMRAENLSSAPASPNPGQMYFDTSDNHLYVWNGSTWKQLDN